MASRRSVAFLGGGAPALCALLCLAPGPAAEAQTPLGTAFTYQGQLNDACIPADGVYDFEFRLFDSPAATNQVGPTVTVGDLPVTAGLFTATLDFGGSVFGGNKRWLEIRVRPGASSGAYTILSPVQELTASPNALFSSTASTAPWSGLTGVPAGFADGIDNDSGGDITGVTAGTGLTGGGTAGAVTVSANFGGSGSAAAVSHSDHHHFGQEWVGDGSQGLRVTNQNLYGGTAVIGNASGTSGASGGVYGGSNSTVGRGVWGVASTTNGLNYGVYGRSYSTAGRGVQGWASATTGNNYGVWGESASTAGVGVFGNAPTATGPTSGVYGLATSSAGAGVTGHASALAGATYGVLGVTASPSGWGVYGHSSSTGGNGVYGWAQDGIGVYGGSWSDWAGWFSGDVQVIGTLYKTGGGFKIDHPLDPENKYLYHSFVESPDMKNIYDGVVTTNDAGYATVELPEWFGAVNEDFRYQLTVIGQFAQAIVAEEIADNRFTIRTSLAGVKVSWQVTGIRKDPFAEKHRIPVEEYKAEAERGKYLHPAVYGQPEERGVDFQHRPELPPHEARGGEPIADAATAP